MSNGPYISCVMVTKAGRYDLATRAIDDFMAQTYPYRNLLIVTDDRAAQWELQGYVNDEAPKPSEGSKADVSFRRGMEGAPLGYLRNLGLDQAGTPLVAQWDDDDRHHPERLALQFAAMVDSPDAICCCLADQLYYFPGTRRLYWVDWLNRRPRFDGINIPGTIMHVSGTPARYPTSGPESSRGEDGAFLNALLAHGTCSTLRDAGWCYLRQCHGSNTWPTGRFTANAAWLGRTADELGPCRAVLEESIKPYGLTTPVDVMGRDGPAYKIGQVQEAP